MSIVQVLVGFGLATILGLVLAEMGSNSSKQSAQIRASIERAAVVQSLQSIISNSEVCKKSIRLSTMGTDAGIPAGQTGGKTYKILFWLDNNSSQQTPVADNTDIPGTSLTTEWIRAFDPQVVTSMTLPAPQTMYVATVKIKLKQKGAPKGSIDLKAVDIGKVFFVLGNTMAAGGTIGDCFGNSAGSYVCPSGQTQAVVGGYWQCVPILQSLDGVCGASSQMVKTATGGTAVCQTFYRVNAACQGGGGVSSDATCLSRPCTVVQTVSGSSGGGTVTIPAHYVSPQTITVSIPGSGTSPGSSSSVTVPGYTIPAQTVSVSGGGGGGGSVNSLGFYNCASPPVCNAGSAAITCNNTAL